MPRTEQVKVFKFEELDDDAKERARDWWRQVSTHDEWWESVYEDAERIGLKITEFNLYRHRIEGELEVTPGEAAQRIIREHGQDCDTYKLACEFYRHKRQLHTWRNPRFTVDDFTHDLLECYLSMLNREWDYINSDEYVDESIIANEYEFNCHGCIWR